MKMSEAILEAYKTNGGQQCVDVTLASDGRMCVLGAFYRARERGLPVGYDDWEEFETAFQRAWGINPINLNNNYDERGDMAEPFPWEHIVGMARAAGL